MMRKPEARLLVTIDDRERRGGVIAALRETQAFDIDVRRLPAGDYLLDGIFLIERKTLPDLAESIKQGRLFSQALRLVESRYRPALILEGVTGDLHGSAMSWEAMQGALITVSMFIGLPVLRSRSVEETARTLLYIARQRRGFALGGLPRHGRRPRGKRALQLHILQGLPGVGPARAAKLLEHFGTVEAAFVADSAALEAVAGMGNIVSRKMRWAVSETCDARYDRL